MKYYVEVTVDTNDGDYVTEINLIEEKDLLLLRKIAKAISEFKPYESIYQRFNGDEITCLQNHNWPDGECCRTDLGEKYADEIYSLNEFEFDFMNDLAPCCEYGFHSITSIEIYPEVKKEKLV